MKLRWRMCLGTVVLFLLLIAAFLFTHTSFQTLHLRLSHLPEHHRRETAALLDQIAITVLACVAASGIVSLLTFRRFGRSVLTPLEQLSSRIDSLPPHAPPLPESGSAEIAALTAAVNRLTTRVRDHQRNRQERLAALARAHHALLRTLPYPVYLLRANNSVAELNPAAERLAERLGLPHETLPPALIPLIHQARTTGQHNLPELLHDSIYLRAGNDELYFLPRILHLRHPDQSPAPETSLAVLLVDVTRFRWLDGMKTSQIATVSHEIKTPLTSIRMMLHLLMEKKYGPLTPPQEEMLHTALEDCARLLNTLHNLLDLARLDAGSGQMTLQPATASSLLQAAHHAFRDAATAASLTFTCSPPQPDPTVSVDDSRIHLAFANLITNALKHASAHIRLHALPAPDPGWTRFTVEDDGPGVPEDHRSRIFERFYRVPGQSHDGAGLGLSIAREIVHAHGGRLSVTSSPLGGAAFHLDLPSSS